MIYIVFSILNAIALFIAAHTHKWMWYVWLFTAVLTGYFFLDRQLYGQLSVNVLVGLICIAPLSTWDSDEEINREKITWGSPILAWLESLVIAVLLYIFFRDTFNNPIFECMGAGSMVVGMYLLSRKRVAAWIIFIYSFVMFGISSVVIGDLKGIVTSIMQTVFSVYGLIRYMEFYQDTKEKEIRLKGTWSSNNGNKEVL
jgi:hypothetical protein